MKKILLALSVLIFIRSAAQISVGSNTPVYVKGQVLYVGQNINLNSNSNLYLRNNSQLVQGTAGSSANTGTGIISVYQEGTSDNFDYNYWCSPVGNNIASLVNNNFGITQLYQPTTSTASSTAAILPVGSYNGLANPLTIASHWIYKLTNANNYSQWTQVGSATAILPGEGFTMKGTSGFDNTDPEGTGIVNNPGIGAQRYDFRGKPNDGNISVAVGSNDAATLTGNPYPSAIHLNAFLLDPANSAATGIAYFWQQDKNVKSHFLSAYRGGYATYSPIDITSNGVYVAATFRSYNTDGTVNSNPPTGTSQAVARKYLPIGQGFLINGNSNGVVTFKNSHRVFYKEGGTLSQFEKPARNLNPKLTYTTKNEDDAVINPPLVYIKLNTIINNEFTRQLAIAFIATATDGIDKGIDAKNMDDDLPNDVSFWIENGNYVIQGVNFDLSKKIPLSVKATQNTTFKFYISQITDFDESQNVYLYDALDMSYHDIKNSLYEVEVVPGTYTDRFKITFTNQTLGINDEVKTNFFIYQDNKNQVLKAFNPNNEIIKSFVLYDMLGKAVITKENLEVESNFNFSTSGVSSGIYIATFVTGDNVKITQKIIISNSAK
ncbi:T9SS type A sorting domain-containing protein [Flavobacterium aquidurense]|uniref:Por secretion system C-terminal sorting domain-containing protein n=1 Tax=Flavobacterium aquidurense TaxID=362413 RepID=A0A0Q1BNU5_9FLAO|nr:T9SS type A sorting domain-containing protein [Flavobacterium aquidurense]KQB42554.1 Por secretion system C-terminal sorting domain-containing protein [Flavobacterium aquidurense]